MTIIAMKVALEKLARPYDCKLKGSRNRMKAAMSRIAPTTVKIVSVELTSSDVSLTVELMEVVHDALNDGATMFLTLKQPHLLRLALVELEN